MAKIESAKTAHKVKHKTAGTDQPLKGTMVSVFLLGLFIIVSWLGVYFLFLDRF
ncbi:cytochrome c oxidase subunit 2A [Bacillus sp. EB01]|uniref:cytochrome c oxidase subunit 2A n=1 Tax=Bacillus sp. EB01 TaxID=1347086 RepID=UPI0005C5BF9D|nr:cytochrome c oxidase subunit 2A [Bacillus sp. EB01]